MIRTRNIYAVFFLLGFFAKAQFYNLPDDYNFSLLTERKLAAKDSSVHSGIKPYIHFFSPKYTHDADTFRIFKYITDDPALDAVFFKHVIGIEPKNGDFKLRIDPILNVQKGKDFEDTLNQWLGINTRGFIASAYIGSDLYCETMFAENQAFFPAYVNNNAAATQIVPGQGRYKVFKKTGYDYAFSSGFVSYQPFKQLNIQAGHGKQKIGDGYRSLLLSDNSFNYPYIRITQQWFKGRLQYSNIYAVLMNLDSASKTPIPNAERLYQKKPAAFQYLSLNLGKSLNLGLFQGIIWLPGDSRNKPQVDAMFFNPLIYSHAMYYGLNNARNVVAGATVKLKLTNSINAYGQFMADDLSDSKSTGNGYGYQIGINYFNALGIKNFFLQAEYNSVTESSYNSPVGAITNQSYSHYNQNLAYVPNYGNEFVINADYKQKRFFGNIKFNYQYLPKNGDHYSDINLFSGNIGYLINPSYNLNVSLGYMHRSQNFPNFNTLNNSTSYLFLSIKTSLYNSYFDF